MKLNRNARSLIDRAAPGLAPSARDRERNRARIAERIALAAAASAAAASSAATVSKTSSAATVAKASAATAVKGGAAGVAASFGGAKIIVLAALGVGLASSAAYVSSVRERPEVVTNAPARETRTAEPANAQSTAVPIVEPAPVPVAAIEEPPKPPAQVTTLEPPKPSARLPAAPTAVPSSPGAQPSATAPPAPPALDAELSLLREAQAAMSRGESAAAMKTLAEHDRRYPNGALAQDREAAQIFALCDLGRIDEARRAGASFLRAHPFSPFADRVRASCAGTR